MRPFLLAGNWKMHTTPAESVALALAIADGVSTQKPGNEIQVLVCPPATSLYPVAEALKARGVRVGAQNCHHEPKGAFTGDISAAMVKATGCEYVIVGHSERRQYYGETDALLNKKLAAALKEGLIPIYCVGETLEERQSGATLKVIEEQMTTALAGITLDAAAQLIIAYEPVWAIGTGLAATSDQAQEVHAFIRSLLQKHYPALAADVLLLYGGSLKPDNAFELLSKPDVNGGLIGGASLQADSLLAIVAAAIQVSETTL
jgi:triosephosphate isomerase